MNIVYCKCIVGNLYLEEINRLILIFSQKSSVVSKAQALLSRDDVTWTTRNEEACVKWIANGENLRLNIPGCLKRGEARFLFVEFRLLTHFSCFMCPLQFLKIFLRVLNFFYLLPTHFLLSSGIVGVSFPGTRDCRGSKEPNRRCWFQRNFKLHRQRFSHAIHHMDKEQRSTRCTVQPKNKIR